MRVSHLGHRTFSAAFIDRIRAYIDDNEKAFCVGTNKIVRGTRLSAQWDSLVYIAICHDKAVRVMGNAI